MQQVGLAELAFPLGQHRLARRPVLGREHVQVVVEQFVERRLGHRLGLAAGRADAPHQPLGQHREQRVGEVERVHAHVQQPGHCLRRAVGVQRGQHQVTGQRGLDRDLGGFLVADLADHDHVRVRAQEGA